MTLSTIILMLALGAALSAAISQPEPTASGGWPIHSTERPLPAQIDAPEAAVPPPSDATVLFDGSSTEAWEKVGGGAISWTIQDDGSMQVQRGGDIVSRELFGDCQLHVEWMCPEGQEHRTGQDRGNSGVFLMSAYEVQVLQSRENRTYADGIAGAIYGQNPPMVNPCRGMGEWNSFDIIFRRPRFNDDGSVARPAVMTVLFNGVLVQDRFELLGPTSHKSRAPYQRHADALPIKLQDHGEPARFRNIWVRRLE
jgi:hypothetical protein